VIQIAFKISGATVLVGALIEDRAVRVPRHPDAQRAALGAGSR